MNLLYSIKEGVKGFRRARLSSFVSVSIVAISLILVGLFLIAAINMTRVVRSIQKRMTLEVFIDNALDESGIAALEDEISGLESVSEVQFVSKEMAAQTFTEEFGKEIFEILDGNPLPSSFRVNLKPEFRAAEEAAMVVEELEAIAGIEEVVYRAELFRLMDQYIGILIAIALVVGVLLLFGSLFVISNTIRIIIHSKRTVIETMKLVGATPSFIRRPFLVEGMLQGFVGGGIAALILFIFVKWTNIELPGLILIEKEIYFLLMLIGLTFGWLGSITAVRRLLRY